MPCVSPEAIARSKEYDKARAKAKRAEIKADPAHKALMEERRRERQNAAYRRKKEAKPPKPIVIAKPRPAPAYHRWSPETEAVIPPNVKRTIAETPKPRFWVEAPAVGFASMGVGRYFP